MSDRCVIIDGARVRVTDKFDSTEGSEDMAAMRALLKAVSESALVAGAMKVDQHDFERDPDRPRVCAVCGKISASWSHRSPAVDSQTADADPAQTHHQEADRG